jgi:hypothetical protein
VATTKSRRGVLTRLRDAGLRRLGVEPYLHRRLNHALGVQRELRDEVRELRRSSAADRRRADSRIADLEKSVADLSDRFATAARRSDRVTRMTSSLDMVFTRRLPLMNRVVSRDVMDTLVGEVAAISGAQRAEYHVSVGYTTLIDLETRGLGRIAGSVQNIVGKLVTVPLLDPPNEDVLEIGTLFGMFAAGLERQLARTGRQPRITIVDPLEGLQLQGGRDDQVDRTAVPVVEDVVRRNLQLAGVPADRVRLFKGLSGDDAIRAAAADRRYGVVVVDGDHSAAGVAADLEYAEQVAAEGAVVVLDDYGDEKWPQVQQAADAHLAGPTRFELIGTVATSAFLRAGPVPSAAAPASAASTR